MVIIGSRCIPRWSQSKTLTWNMTGNRNYFNECSVFNEVSHLTSLWVSFWLSRENPEWMNFNLSPSSTRKCHHQQATPLFSGFQWHRWLLQTKRFHNKSWMYYTPTCVKVATGLGGLIMFGTCWDLYGAAVWSWRLMMTWLPLCSSRDAEGEKNVSWL